MNILFCITKSEAGGAQTHVYDMMRFCKSQGDTVIVLSAPGGWLEAMCTEEHISFIGNPWFSNSFSLVKQIKSLLFVKKTIQEIQPELLSCHSSGAAAVVRCVAPKSIPVVYTAHGWGFNIGVPPIQKGIAILVEKILAFRTKKIICVSEFVRNLAMNYYIAQGPLLSVVHNGVEVPPFEKTLAFFEKKPVQITFVGRFASPKRQDRLVAALAILPENVRKSVHISFVGDGPKKSVVEKTIREISGLQYDFLGSVDPKKVLETLSQSHICVFLSDWEGFPYVILEAMAQGVVVIANNVGGIAEAVDQDTGILLDSLNEKIIAEKIAVLVQAPEQMYEFAKKAHEKVAIQFHKKTQVKKMYDLYLSCISQSN